MAGPSLYFPDGIPPNVQRLVDPDAIHRLVQEGLKGLEGKWGRLAPLAGGIADGERPWWRKIFGGYTSIPSKWLVASLYLDPKRWPSGLSAQQKKQLLLLRRVRDLQFRPVEYTFRSLDEARGATLPTEEELLKALQYMAKDTKSDLFKPMVRLYNRMLSEVGKEIEPLCLEIYGETCESGEGAAIANADIIDSHKINRLPMSAAGERVMDAFLSLYRS